MIGLKQQFSCRSIINEFNFTELSDEIEELYVEYEKYAERLATVSLQIIYINKQNVVSAGTVGSLQDFVIILKNRTKLKLNRRYNFRKSRIKRHSICIVDWTKL